MKERIQKINIRGGKIGKDKSIQKKMELYMV